MGPLKCCVGGCTSTSQTQRLFCFPKNDGLRSLWLSKIVPREPRLIMFSKEQLLRQRVCEKHFDRQQFDEDGRRLRYSYPCLLTDNEIAHGVPLQSPEDLDVLSEHNYSKRQEVDDGSVMVSMVGGAEWNIQSEHNYSAEKDNIGTETLVVTERADVQTHHDQPSCSHYPPDASIANKGNDVSVALEKQVTRDNTKKHSAVIKIKLSSKKIKFIKPVRNMASDGLDDSATQQIVRAQERGKDDGITADEAKSKRVQNIGKNVCFTQQEDLK